MQDHAMMKTLNKDHWNLLQHNKAHIHLCRIASFSFNVNKKTSVPPGNSNQSNYKTEIEGVQIRKKEAK